MSTHDRYQKMSEALRENLLKRKQQARAKRAAPLPDVSQEQAKQSQTSDDQSVQRRLWGRSLTRPLSNAQKHILTEGMTDFGIPVPACLQHKNHPMPSCDSWPGTFWHDFEAYALEIGLGDGEHITHYAEQNSKTGIIGAERFINGLVTCLQSIQAKNLKNIRIFPDDAGLLWRSLPHYSLDHIYILFPDPWPKKRHHKRRLVQSAFLKTCYTYLKPHGKIWVASDIPDYIHHTHDAFRVVKDLYVYDGEHPAPITKYGRKALREGRSSVMLCYQKQ